MPIETKYRCPICGFESNAPGICPTCDENMLKICLCGSGQYATKCCEIAPAKAEDESKIAAEVKAEAFEEALKEAEIVPEEEAEEKIEE
jgi:hypothetical protein